MRYLVRNPGALDTRRSAHVHDTLPLDREALRFFTTAQVTVYLSNGHIPVLYDGGNTVVFRGGQ
jgi:hypothetical protein